MTVSGKGRGGLFHLNLESTMCNDSVTRFNTTFYKNFLSIFCTYCHRRFLQFIILFYINEKVALFLDKCIFWQCQHIVFLFSNQKYVDKTSGYQAPGIIN